MANVMVRKSRLRERDIIQSSKVLEDALERWQTGESAIFTIRVHILRLIPLPFYGLFPHLHS